MAIGLAISSEGLSEVYEYRGTQADLDPGTGRGLKYHIFVVEDVAHSDGVKRTWVIDIFWQHLPEEIKAEAARNGFQGDDRGVQQFTGFLAAIRHPGR